MLANDAPTLFAVEALWCDPLDLGTADCSLLCRGDDGCDYAIKDGVKNAAVPHSEWFCTNLAELVGIAAPPCRIIKLPDGSFAFGSRWEGGVIGPNEWGPKVRNGEIDFWRLAPVLSRIYAFDHFINNVDRHAGNLLVRSQRSDYAVFAFDYSRSWITSGRGIPTSRISANEHTIQLQRAFASLFGTFIAADVCDVLLGKIGSIGTDVVEAIIRRHPAGWLSSEDKLAILTWWQSTSFKERLEDIARGIRDGSYL